MSDVITGSKAELDSIAAVDSTVHGFPRKGIPIGAGPHAPISEAPGDGWTMKRVDVFTYADPPTTHAIDVDAELEVTGQQHAPTAAKLAQKKVKDKDKLPK